MQSVDLGERHLATIKCDGDPPALAEQPVRVPLTAERTFLQICRVSTRKGHEPARAAPHKNAFGAEHRAIRIDTDTPVGGTARIEPPHLMDHEPAGHQNI